MQVANPIWRATLAAAGLGLALIGGGMMWLGERESARDNAPAPSANWIEPCRARLALVSRELSSDGLRHPGAISLTPTGLRLDLPYAQDAGAYLYLDYSNQRLVSQVVAMNLPEALAWREKAVMQGAADDCRQLATVAIK